MIFLIGFMGSGKSTVAKQLSDKLHMSLIEMDEKIEEQEKKSISDIFNHCGEAYFREKETQLLKKIYQSTIISTGGGIILSQENREYLKRGTVIYLQASWETINHRLSNDDSRPLWSGGSEEKKQRFESRLDLYEQTADVVINVNGKSTEQIVEEIVSRLNG